MTSWRGVPTSLLLPGPPTMVAVCPKHLGLGPATTTGVLPLVANPNNVPTTALIRQANTAPGLAPTIPPAWTCFPTVGVDTYRPIARCYQLLAQKLLKAFFGYCGTFRGIRGRLLGRPAPLPIELAQRLLEAAD
jgi:hypothetical protein